MSDRELNLLYVHGESIGYGRLGVKLAEQLPKLGVDVYDDLPGPEGEAIAPSFESTKAIGLRDAAENLRQFDPDSGMVTVEEPSSSKKCNTVCWVSTPTHARGWWTSQHSAMFTMWESTRLPEAFRDTMDEFDTIIVPSAQNQELFSRYHDNVQLCYLGVDPDEWHFVERPPADTEFRFLIGGSGSRKGVDLAWKAFWRLWGKEGSWGSGPTPILHFKSPKGGDYPTLNGRVRLTTSRVTPAQEQAIYADSHVYLQPSRGEGFGLQPLQAIAQGLPTILTDAHGHAGFSHLGYGLSTTPSEADYFIYGDAGEWWEPSLDDLCEWMKWCYENYDQAKAEAAKSAATVAREWTWANTAQQFCDILDVPMSQPFTDSGWHKPERRLYPLSVQLPKYVEIGGYQFYWEPGKVYWETADVKRIAFEAGWLDPSCLPEATGTVDAPMWMDAGITEAQAKRLGDYSARYSHCPTCSQRLNTVPTRADDLLRLLDERDPLPA